MWWIMCRSFADCFCGIVKLDLRIDEQHISVVCAFFGRMHGKVLANGHSVVWQGEPFRPTTFGLVEGPLLFSLNLTLTPVQSRTFVRRALQPATYRHVLVELSSVEPSGAELSVHVSGNASMHPCMR